MSWPGSSFHSWGNIHRADLVGLLNGLSDQESSKKKKGRKIFSLENVLEPKTRAQEAGGRSSRSPLHSVTVFLDMPARNMDLSFHEIYPVKEVLTPFYSSIQFIC